MARIQRSDFKNWRARMLLHSFAGECSRSANQPIRAGLYKAYVCTFSELQEIEMLLFYADSKSLLRYMYKYSEFVLYITMFCLEC